MTKQNGVLRGLKDQECERGNRTNRPPIPYVPVVDEIQDVIFYTFLRKWIQYVESPVWHRLWVPYVSSPNTYCQRLPFIATWHPRCQKTYLFERYSKQIHKDPEVSGKDPVDSTAPVSTIWTCAVSEVSEDTVWHHQNLHVKWFLLFCSCMHLCLYHFFTPHSSFHTLGALSYTKRL